MMMPPPFAPVRTPEESKSPRPVPAENSDSPKQKNLKPTPAKAKSPTDNKPLATAAAAAAVGLDDNTPKSIIIQQTQSMKPAVVSVIRPQSAGASSAAHNGFAKVEAQRIVSTKSSAPLLDLKHVITNPKLEIERIQSSYNGEKSTFILFIFSFRIVYIFLHHY